MSRVRLFGKLPAHGDFVSRGWRADERDAIDAWLSASLDVARDVHGADFDDRFGRAPPWRHVGFDTGGEGVSGALAASQDAAGRRFPLFLVLAGETSDAAAEACETLLYSAISEGWTADTLVAQADAVPRHDDPATSADRWWTIGGDGFAPAECTAARPADLIAAMLTVSA